MNRPEKGPGALELVEDAFRLLRELPLAAWLCWASGVLPFALFLVAFLSGMTSSTGSSRALASQSLILGVLFVWLGVAQTIFAGFIRSRLAGETIRPYRVLDVLGTAGLLQVSAAVFVPLNFASVIAAPWMLAFYQNAAAYPFGEKPASFVDVVRYAAREASRWTSGNLVCALLLALLAAVVFVNVFVLLIAGPILFRTFTGVESEFTRDPLGMLNLTTFCAATAITWICLDPVLKAVYAGRCFRAESLHSGADLRAALNEYRTAVHTAIVAGLLLLPTRLLAQPEAVQPEQLERSIQEVVSRPEYAWRSPEVVRPDLDFAVVRFLHDAVRSTVQTLRDALSWVVEFLAKLLQSVLGRGPSPGSGGPGPSSGFLTYLLIGLIVVILGGVCYLVIRRTRKPVPASVAASAVAPVVDLGREDVTPDQLPGSEWLALADEFLHKGDLRMACRAVFLAMLAALGSQGDISIHRAKSNLDYLRELMRRTRGESALHDLVRQAIAVFERAWYGGHELTREAFDEYRAAALKAGTHAE